MLGDMYRFGKGVGKDYAAAEDWYKDAATQDYLPARTRLEELEGLASPRTVMIRPMRKPAPPVRSARPAESEGEAPCELAFSDLRKYIALNDSRFPPASWRQRHCLPAPELRGAGVQVETLDASTESRLPPVKPSREAAVAAPQESLEMETPESATSPSGRGYTRPDADPLIVFPTRVLPTFELNAELGKVPLGPGRTTLTAPDWNLCCRWR